MCMAKEFGLSFITITTSVVAPARTWIITISALLFEHPSKSVHCQSFKSAVRDEKCAWLSWVTVDVLIFHWREFQLNIAAVCQGDKVKMEIIQHAMKNRSEKPAIWKTGNLKNRQSKKSGESLLTCSGVHSTWTPKNPATSSSSKSILHPLPCWHPLSRMLPWCNHPHRLSKWPSWILRDSDWYQRQEKTLRGYWWNSLHYLVTTHHSTSDRKAEERPLCLWTCWTEW